MRTKSNIQRAEYACSSVYQACINLLDLIASRAVVSASISQINDDNDDEVNDGTSSPSSWGGLFPVSRTLHEDKNLTKEDSDVIDLVEDDSVEVEMKENESDDVIDLTQIGTGTC